MLKPVVKIFSLRNKKLDSETILQEGKNEFIGFKEQWQTEVETKCFTVEGDVRI